jgi:hypothetical protein
MSTVTDLSARRRKPPEPDVAGWVERADEEIRRTAASPNEVLNGLLAAGCKVAFAQGAGTTDITATVTMPGGSTVSETGVNAVAALLFAYGAGAWLADLPAALAATAEPSKGAS